METKALSQQKTAHALRHFILCGALWAVYGPNATVAGSIFSGFALDIGLSEAQIAFLVSLSSFAGVSQMLSFYVTRRIRNRQAFMVSLGHVEITAASSIVLLALAAPQYRFLGMAALLVTAYMIGHTVSPLFNSWFSNVLPDEVRATYTGRRMFIITVTSMVYLYLASAWIDHVPGLRGFAVVFAVGWLAGLAGYWLLMVTPMPPLNLPATTGFLSSFSEVWRTPGFGVLAVFYCTWTVGLQLAGAFYGVYMLNYLHLTYSRIAIYTNITLFLMVAGYLVVGPLAQRYGSKPLAQILIIPGMAVPLLWAITTPQNCRVVIPIACVISGLSISGVSVSVSSLLYKIVPHGRDNSPYFANWTGLWALASASGPLAGGYLRNALPETTAAFGLELTSIQVIFAIAGCMYVAPLVASALLRDTEAASPRYLLGQFRGNLLSYAYNFALYQLTREDTRRARAIRDLGRSGTPLAVPPLLRALGHMSPEVRTEAARGLGDGHFVEAVEPLKAALEDQGSDIRSAAAEALGKIGHDAAFDSVLQALGDGDAHVRISAAMALGQIGDSRAADTLLEALCGPHDPALFPTLVESAAHRYDLRLVEPILRGLPKVRQPVVRMQVLNGLCRVLGEKNHFYRLANADGLQAAALSEGLLQRVFRLLRSSKGLGADTAGQLGALARRAAEALNDERVGEFALAAREIAEVVQDATGAPPVARHAARGIIVYLDQGEHALLPGEGAVFLVIALMALSRSLAGQHGQDRDC